MLHDAGLRTSDGLRTIRRDLALVDPEFAMLLPSRMRVQRLGIPAGEPGSWSWEALKWERDPWAQEFVLRHPGGATLEEVGAVLGFTRERTRQVEQAALRKVAREAMRLGLSARDELDVLRELREKRAPVAL